MSKKTIAFLAGYPIKYNMINELEGFGELLGEKVNLHLITGPQEMPDSIKQYFEVFQHKLNYAGEGRLGRLMYAFVPLARYLKTHRPHVITNVAKQYPLGVAVVILAKRAGIPSVLRITGDYISAAYKHRALYKRIPRIILKKHLLTALFRRADAVLTLGDNMKQKLVQQGMATDKIGTVPQPFLMQPNGQLTNAEAKQKLGLDLTRKTILFVGRVCRDKGSDRLAEIAKVVLAKSDQFQFCLVGPVNRDERQRFAGFDECDVRCTGALPKNEVHDYYRAADLFVLPSRHEGLPFVILEALAFDVPVVATPVGEINNYVKNTFSDSEDFSSYILTEDWYQDILPEWFEFSNQKNMYLSSFLNGR